MQRDTLLGSRNHQRFGSWASTMMTLSSWNIFRVTGPLCGEFNGHRWIPLTKPVTRSCGVFFELWLNIQSWGWRFETPSRALWRHCNDNRSNNKMRIPFFGDIVSGTSLLCLTLMWNYARLCVVPIRCKSNSICSIISKESYICFAIYVLMWIVYRKGVSLVLGPILMI